MNGESLNGRFILEPYTASRQITSTTGSGFAMISQKVNLIGLKILVDVRSTQIVSAERMAGHMLARKGNIAWIREEFLHTAEWSKKLLECSAIEGKFMIVDQQYVEFVTAE